MGDRCGYIGKTCGQNIFEGHVKGIRIGGIHHRIGHIDSEGNGIPSIWCGIIDTFTDTQFRLNHGGIRSLGGHGAKIRGRTRICILFIPGDGDTVPQLIATICCPIIGIEDNRGIGDRDLLRIRIVGILIMQGAKIHFQDLAI